MKKNLLVLFIIIISLFSCSKNIDKGKNNYKTAVEYMSNGDYENAVKYYKLAIEAGNIEAITNLGDCYFEQKKYRLAKEYYEMNLENENNNKKVEILNNLEEIKKMGY